MTKGTVFDSVDGREVVTEFDYSLPFEDSFSGTEVGKI